MEEERERERAQARRSTHEILIGSRVIACQDMPECTSCRANAGRQRWLRRPRRHRLPCVDQVMRIRPAHCSSSVSLTSAPCPASCPFCKQRKPLAVVDKSLLLVLTAPSSSGHATRAPSTSGSGQAPRVAHKGRSTRPHRPRHMNRTSCR